MNQRLLAGLALAVSVVGAAGLWTLTHRRAALPVSAPSSPAASSLPARPSGRPNPNPPRESHALVWPFETPKPTVVPLADMPDEVTPVRGMSPEAREARRRERAQRAPDAGAHPGYSRACEPAARARDRILPRHPWPTVRPLSQRAMESGMALLRGVQDRDHLASGDRSRLTVEIVVDGARVPFSIQHGELRKPGAAPGAPPESIAPVVFRDDGTSPDEQAKDGVQTASVGLGPALADFSGDLTVRAEVSTAKETGEIVFPIVAAGPSPAEFTGSVREAVEGGSLALYAAVRVRKAGHYEFTGRLYDSERRAMAVFETSTTLDASAREVRLEVCGKVLRDEKVAGPWELRDVEGYLLGEIGGRPDLVPMRILEGPHRTRVYPLETFSDHSP